jgi:hypothetical protein
MKLIKIVFKSGEGTERTERVNFIKVHYMDVWEYHNETLRN